MKLLGNHPNAPDPIDDVVLLGRVAAHEAEEIPWSARSGGNRRVTDGRHTLDVVVDRQPTDKRWKRERDGQEHRQPDDPRALEAAPRSG